MKTDKIHFEKAAIKHQELIFRWLEEPHMKEFWDNSQEHKDDILNFINGHKQHYFYGTTQYWIGYVKDEPYSFILSDQLLIWQNDLSDPHKMHLSKSGNSISLDFGIGNIAFLKKGLAAPTLQAFTEFYRNSIDPKADIFFIDPNVNNPKALHVYTKAGFELVGNYEMKEGFFKTHQHFLLMKKFPSQRNQL